jgi:hypothetical protein
MNASTVVGGGDSTEELGRIAWGGFSRVLLAGLVLVLAAVVMTMSGGAGFGGKLGALFGLHSRQGGKPATAIQVAAPAPVLQPTVVASATPRRSARPAPRVRLRSRHPAATGPQRTQAPGPRPNPAPAPAPAQPPPAPPVQVPKPPPPAPSGNVQQVARTVHDTVPAVVPAPAQPVVQPVLQPVLDQTTAAVDQACGLVGGCP